MSPSEKLIYTVGHGSRSIEEFLACLSSFGVRAIVDARQWPSSRHHPHFTREELEPSLSRAGVRYRWLGKELGGRRPQGYAEHMRTTLFLEGLDRLDAIAEAVPTAVMCAERDPAACHRRHIATVLERRGFGVRHIIDPDRLLLPGERPEDQGTLFPLE